MAAIPDSIKIKLEVDTSELDIAIEKLKLLIKLQQKSSCMPHGIMENTIRREPVFDPDTKELLGYVEVNEALSKFGTERSL